ncbi:dihydroxyacetone kinase phosphoryl donor subunit DhaM [Providencia sneebia]|uniref:phosphoenolpyruvate--glycerone phosphotransferase n=1 Tax=Providencia sneebia DSM 19967 TaxID=1141660 RepID=K8W1B8_9GAMM|nr:dihydroxyacetone kinase phosphoryl donor subunit DhaM [Providencia sneebia]EKT54249.1 dihydroxyacetone kinase subunit M [Providencia sneebia DSM 19967]
MIGLIIISHSKMLADGLLQLAEQMQDKKNCQIIAAAGIDDEEHPIGTDAIKVMEAIETLSEASHIILLMDLGSALLSAETALDLIDPDLAQKVYLCSAPLVEGTIAITAATSGGASIDTVLEEARQALRSKQQQLNDESTEAASQETEQSKLSDKAIKSEWIVKNPSGLHVRPAAKLAALLSGFDVDVELCKDKKYADAKSMNQIALLQVRYGDKITLIAEGPDSATAITAFEQLAKQNFGDDIHTNGKTVLNGKNIYTPTVSGVAYHWKSTTEYSSLDKEHLDNESIENRINKVTQAITLLKKQLEVRANNLTEQLGKSIADIFRGHSLLLDDDDIIDAIKYEIKDNNSSIYDAINFVFNEMSAQYKQLDDPYLQARYIDIDDLKNQLLMLIFAIKPQQINLTVPSIILSDNMGPSEILRCQHPMVSGVILANGSPYSHTSIIAARLGIPMLVDIGETINDIKEKAKLTISIDDASLTIE